MKFEYWKICLEELFDQYNIKVEITDEMVNDFAISSEMEYECSGLSSIPNPLCNEVSELKQKLILLEKSHENQLHNISKGVARRRNIDVNDVHIDEEGNITYYP